jgi:hypothetical protein
MKFKVVKEFRNSDTGAVMIVGSVIDCDRDRAAIYRRHGLIGTFDLAGSETADQDAREAARIVPDATATESPSETADDAQAPRRRAGRPRKQE